MEGATVAIVDLPEGQRWAYYQDMNVVGLSSRLDPAEHSAALDELQQQWRASLVIPSAPVDSPSGV